MSQGSKKKFKNITDIAEANHSWSTIVIKRYGEIIWTPQKENSKH